MGFSITISGRKHKELRQVVEQTADKFKVTQARALKAVASLGIEAFEKLPEDEKQKLVR